MSGSPPHSLVAPETAYAMCDLAGTCPPGALVEVGVYHGGTAWYLARLALEQHRDLYLYDTFEGIPYALEGVDSHKIGDFKDTTLREVKEAIPSAIIVKGIFPESAMEMGPVAFVHLDCDQYQSYRDAFAYFENRMVPGGVIWCDDVLCLPSADKALAEYVARGGRGHVEMANAAHPQKPYLQF